MRKRFFVRKVTTHITYNAGGVFLFNVGRKCENGKITYAFTLTRFFVIQFEYPSRQVGIRIASAHTY